MTIAYTGQAGQQHDPDPLQKHWPNQMNAGLGETKDQALQQPKPKATMKYKYENLIRDYIADTSQIVQYRSPNIDNWTTWVWKVFPHFEDEYEWRLLPAPKPDVVVVGRLTVFKVVEANGLHNIRATFDAVTGELKSVEKI